MPMKSPMSDTERFENFRIELERLCRQCQVQIGIDCESDVIYVRSLSDGDDPIYEGTPLKNEIHLNSSDC